MSSCTHIDSTSARAPKNTDRVHKEECTLCYKNWEDDEGIFVCLSCFNGGCTKHAGLHFKKRKHSLALNIKRVLKPQLAEEPPKKITKLAIGVEGGLGFDSEDRYEYKLSVFCFSCGTFIPTDSSTSLAQAVAAVMSANSVRVQDEQKAWELKLTGCEHTLTLQQSTNAGFLAKKSLSHCGACDISSNLWLCMTCGSLGCARKNFDGSGGNGHAVAHFEQTKHPLVCKIGTITPEGNADIYCYLCDEERVDDQLTLHLATFGISVSSLQKTEQTMAEMNLALNNNFDPSVALEEGKEMIKMYGPGFTGLQNLGNTCYLNSTVQVLMALPRFMERYYNGAEEHINTCTNVAADCFHCQMAKLVLGMYSGDYSSVPKGSDQQSKDDDQKGIAPRMWRSLVVKDHKEFQTNQQQDAYEFYQYVLKTIQQKERAGGKDPTKTLEFDLLQRLECSNCHHVRYSELKKQTEISLSLPFTIQPIEGEKAVDRAKREAAISIPFDKCLETFLADELNTFTCPDCKQSTQAIKSYRFLNYPETLVVVMRRFVFEDWVPRKTGVQVNTPDKIDLDVARAHGPRPTEQLMSSGDSSSAPQKPQLNESFVSELMNMGFPRNRAERAVFTTKNAGAEVAMNWLLEHMEDADIDQPLVPPQSAAPSKPQQAAPNPEMVENLTQMGFTAAQARKALKETNNNAERAVEWLFSHTDDMVVDEPESSNQSSAPAQPSKQSFEIDQKPAGYELTGIIVHLGSSTHSGHYVAYIKKNGQWVLYNDRKVTVSEKPPIGGCYLSIWTRIAK